MLLCGVMSAEGRRLEGRRPRVGVSRRGLSYWSDHPLCLKVSCGCWLDLRSVTDSGNHLTAAAR